MSIERSKCGACGQDSIRYVCNVCGTDIVTADGAIEVGISLFSRPGQQLVREHYCVDCARKKMPEAMGITP